MMKCLEEKRILMPGNQFFLEDNEKVMITQSETLPALNVLNFNCLGKNFNSFYL
jgi:hypothetical protein